MGGRNLEEGPLVSRDSHLVEGVRQFVGVKVHKVILKSSHIPALHKRVVLLAWLLAKSPRSQLGLHFIVKLLHKLRVLVIVGHCVNLLVLFVSFIRNHHFP